MKNKMLLILLPFSIHIAVAQNQVSKILLEKPFNLELLRYVSEVDIEISNDDFIELLKHQNDEQYYITYFQENGICIRSKEDKQYNLYFFLYGVNILAVQEVYGYNISQAIFDYKENQWRKSALLNEAYIPQLINPEFKVPSIEIEQPYLNIVFGISTIDVKLNELEVDRWMRNNYKVLDNETINDIEAFSITYEWDGKNFIKKKNAYNKKLGQNLKSYLYQTFESGPGVYNFTCPYAALVNCSNSLPNQGVINYQPKNLTDNDKNTAWSEASSGYGKGEFIEFIVKEKIVLPSFLIENGYAKNEATFKNNNRIKLFKVYLNDKIIGTVELLDTPKPQQFELLPTWLKINSVNKNDKIKFAIESVYKGIKYDDTVISTFVITGNCE